MVFLVKTEAKKALSTLAISIALVTSSPTTFNSGPISAPNLSFDVYGLVESFLVVLHIPCQTQLQVSVGFSNSVSARSARLHAPLRMPMPASTLCTLVCHSHIPDENTSANMEKSNKILQSSTACCRTERAEYVTFPVPMDLVWFSPLVTVISFCLRMQHLLGIHVKY